jgi:hypothetical protein
MSRNPEHINREGIPMKTNGPLNLRAIAAVGGAALASLALGACGGYDKGEAESTITEDLSGQVEGITNSPISSASCPDDVELEAGTTFECTATLENGEELTVDAEIVDDDGNAEFNVSPEELNSAAGS